MKFSLPAFFLFSLTAVSLATPIEEMKRDKVLHPVALPVVHFTPKPSLLARSIKSIHGANHTSDSWARFVLVQCMQNPACTGTVSYHDPASNVPWVGYLFGKGPVITKDFEYTSRLTSGIHAYSI